MTNYDHNYELTKSLNYDLKSNDIKSLNYGIFYVKKYSMT